MPDICSLYPLIQLIALLLSDFISILTFFFNVIKNEKIAINSALVEEGKLTFAALYLAIILDSSLFINIHPSPIKLSARDPSVYATNSMDYSLQIFLPMFIS